MSQKGFHWRRRGLSAAVLVVVGAGLAVATWAGGSPGWSVAVAAFYLVAATVAWLWAGRDGDGAAILRSDGDERIRSIDRDATAFTGLAVTAVAIVGAMVEAAGHGGDPGAYGVLCVVAGITYAASAAVLRARR